jgi:hypothetical protein
VSGQPPTPQLSPGRADRAADVLSLALLFALAALGFAAFHATRGTLCGRDGLGHAYAFLNSLYGSNRSANAVVQFLLGFEANYGVGLRLLTLPSWLLLGPRPWTFALVNLVVFAATMLALRAGLKRMGGDTGWTLVLGLLVLSGADGVDLYFLYDIDALYVLACLPIFLHAVLRRPNPLVLAAIVAAALLVRLNTVFYLAAPLAIEIVAAWRERRTRRTSDAPRASRAWWVVLGALAAIDLAFYVPQVGFLYDYVAHHEDFSFANRTYSPGLLKADNWLFYVRGLDQWYGPPAWIAVLVLAVLGLRTLPRATRGRFLAYVLVPPFLYSFIPGTRVPTYVAPSVLVIFSCAVLGLSRLRPVALRFAIVAAIAFTALARFSLLHGLEPPPVLGPWTGPAVRALVPRGEMWPPEDGNFGDYDRARRLGGMLFPDRDRVRVGLVSATPFPQGPQTAVLVPPFLEFSRRASFRLVGPSDAGPFHLVLQTTPRRDDPPPLPDELRPAFRRIGAFAIATRVFVQVYLPEPLSAADRGGRRPG